MPILAWNRVWFSRELRELMSVFILLIPNEPERKRNMRIRNAFPKLFCLRSNLGNDNITSRLMTGLKTGMNFRGLVWKPVSKITFFGVKYFQDLGNRAAHPHEEFPGVPLPPPPHPPIDSKCYPRLNKWISDWINARIRKTHCSIDVIYCFLWVYKQDKHEKKKNLSIS